MRSFLSVVSLAIAVAALTTGSIVVASFIVSSENNNSTGRFRGSNAPAAEGSIIYKQGHRLGTRFLHTSLLATTLWNAISKAIHSSQQQRHRQQQQQQQQQFEDAALRGRSTNIFSHQDHEGRSNNRENHVFDAAQFLRDNNSSATTTSYYEDDDNDGLSARLVNESQMRHIHKGCRVAIYWPEYSRYYEAIVIEMSVRSTTSTDSRFLVQYMDDDVREWIDPWTDTFKIIDASMGSNSMAGVPSSPSSWTQIDMKDLLAAVRLEHDQVPPAVMQVQ